MKSTLATLGIIAGCCFYVVWMFLMLFRPLDGVWYNCMYARGNNSAEIACGVKK